MQDLLDLLPIVSAHGQTSALLSRLLGAPTSLFVRSALVNKMLGRAPCNAILRGKQIFGRR
jgi:hypothetical protein